MGHFGGEGRQQICGHRCSKHQFLHFQTFGQKEYQLGLLGTNEAQIPGVGGTASSLGGLLVSACTGERECRAQNLIWRTTVCGEPRPCNKFAGVLDKCVIPSVVQVHTSDVAATSKHVVRHCLHDTFTALH